MMGVARQLERELQSVGKPRAVEGILDLYLIRPGGFLIAKFLRSTPVTPNMVSVAALLTGWATAYFLGRTAALGNVPVLSLLAGLFMVLHSFLDSADGQLARFRGTATELGRIIDGIADYLSFGAIYLAIAYGLWRYNGGSPVLPFAFALVAALSHAAQCAAVEYQRNLYRCHVYGTELPASDRPEPDSRSPGSGHPPVANFLHRIYSAIQRLLGGSSLALWQRIEASRRDHPEREAEISALFRRRNRSRLAAWALLASNSHKVGVVAGAFIPVAPDALFANLGLYVYFLFVTVGLNLLLVVMLASQRKVDRRLWQTLDAET